ncbi:methyltransferase domain-containing protein [Streptomyces marincola]|uniref:methyltransferase domain-containing protein n=1 Tax=Streptomyces marincola TaxID=2878388 RepID=UPI001CF1999B|nr:methyltransferase domain-containing protein [Streptomyces marincola]UCM88262.1 methyltransferase domain-containing protein [Streptomyces marincola]
MSRPAVARAPVGPVPAGAGAPWAEVLRSLPRAVFLPDLIWPYHPDGTGPVAAVRRADEPERWWAAADADVPVVTQWDDGVHAGASPGRVPTSSASAPSLVAAMLAALDAEPGMRVLEVGTGTGWNAALLAHRLGAGHVTSVEVDERVAARARRALRRTGLGVRVVTGDGLLGAPGRGPFDRVVATCGIRSVPPAWLAQVRPGGVILAPWGTPYSSLDALVRLTVRADGTADGRFLALVEFMKARAQRSALPDYPRDLPVTDTTTAAWPPPGPWHPFPFLAGLRMQRAAHAVETHPDGHTQWLYDLAGDGWTAVVRRNATGPGAVVRRAGRRRLWDELLAVHDWWRAAGRPGVERFGLTVARDGMATAWLDAPGHGLAPG